MNRDTEEYFEYLDEIANNTFGYTYAQLSAWGKDRVDRTAAKALLPTEAHSATLERFGTIQVEAERLAQDNEQLRKENLELWDENTELKGELEELKAQFNVSDS